MRLKNKITRHESRRPRPNTTGPSDPVENLGQGQRAYEDEMWYGREDVEVDGEPHKEYLIKLGVSAIIVWYRDGAYGSDMRAGREEGNEGVPRASTPQRKPLGRDE